MVTKDAEHKFDLSLQLGDLKTAYNIALENEVISKYSKISVLIFRFLPMIYSLSVKIEFFFGDRGHSVTVVLSNAVTLAFKGVL